MSGHVPVMLAEVMAALEPRDGGVYVDGTFGRGGYARAILEAAATQVFGIDRDPEAITFGAELSARYDGRLTVLQGCFGDLRRLMADAGVEQVDGIVFDLGVSSPQLETAARGFSFRQDGPLDMRMSADGPSAADFVNSSSETEIAQVIRTFGEERQARRIARAIVAARGRAPLTTTGQLADLVRSIVRASPKGLDPATRTFLALRIQVNDELGELERGLEAAELLLAAAGRLAVVSFHSLEDRLTKNFLHTRAAARGRGSRHLPDPAEAGPDPSFRLLSRRAMLPGDAETAANPRARSARLRAAVRTDAPAWAREAAA